jgi:small subunit ribosomal protein S4
MIRKHKRYSRPRKKFDKTRIEEENKLLEKYGLKSKREIWKADARIDEIRRQAKELITSSHEEQEKLFNKLRGMGFRIKNMADVLGLGKEDWLKRRLQSLVVEKKLARKAKQARQLIVHKHIAIDNEIINVPSYIVSVNEEDRIKIVKINKRLEDIAEKIKANKEKI